MAAVYGDVVKDGGFLKKRGWAGQKKSLGKKGRAIKRKKRGRGKNKYKGAAKKGRGKGKRDGAKKGQAKKREEQRLLGGGATVARQQ